MRTSLLFFFIFAGSLAQAKSIETPYLDLVVPDTYECTSETGRYVCQAKIASKSDSILTMVFKRSGPQDNIEQYKQFISRPMSRVTPSGPPALSKVAFVRTIKIAGHEWVEAKHLESELPNYTTYYWATVRSPVAMVVTFSVEKSREAGRMTELTRIRDSLRTKFVQYSPPENQQVAPGAPSSEVGPQPVVMNEEKLIFGQKPIVVLAGIAIVIALIFIIARR